MFEIEEFGPSGFNYQEGCQVWIHKWKWWENELFCIRYKEPICGYMLYVTWLWVSDTEGTRIGSKLGVQADTHHEVYKVRLIYV